jgi:hypothetical protein
MVIAPKGITLLDLPVLQADYYIDVKSLPGQNGD